jgi:hypothetical protein
MKTATAVFAETLDNFQRSTLLNPQAEAVCVYPTPLNAFADDIILLVCFGLLPSSVFKKS